MSSMEGVGVPTRHPHPSHLYNTLVSKNWQVEFCNLLRLCASLAVFTCDLPMIIQLPGKFLKGVA
jgi:hypothetical protein